ncbi:DUF1660 family phage protein [Candidatus Dojkabacteria bacterium]|jgi:hypothetical protein|nr:DUF1660 family phage protein [Candidatus Dojkabacteria bacterium]
MKKLICKILGHKWEKYTTLSGAATLWVCKRCKENIITGTI